MRFKNRFADKSIFPTGRSGSSAGPGLARLSLKNVRQSVQDYAIYFVTLVLGVAIFYIFNAIETQTTYQIVSETAADVLKLMTNAITGMSVFVAFVLGFLVVYASRFLMKRRNREFALYMTLGMSKGQVAGILSLESLIIGIFSLAAGLLIGIGLSQVMSILVARLFEADLSRLTFTFSWPAFAKTIIYFGIIMLVVVLSDLIMVGKASLITLMNSGTKAEKVRMKNPVLCVALFILGAAVLIFAYSFVTADLYQLAENRRILLPIFAGIAGTFLVFWSVSGMLLSVVSHIKGIYYKGLNCFSIRQFSSRINTMVVSVTVICVMLFFTIAILSGAFSMRSSLNRGYNDLTPADVNLVMPMSSQDHEDAVNEDAENATPEEAHSHSQMTPADALENAGLDPNQVFEGYITVYTYWTMDFTLADAFGSFKEEFEKKYPSLGFGYAQTLMTLSDYNRVAALYGNEPLELGENEYAIVSNTEDYARQWAKVLSAGERITVFGNELIPGYTEPQYGFLEMSASYEETGLFIIPDGAADPAYRSTCMLLGNYRAADDQERMQAEEMLTHALNQVNAQPEENDVFMNSRIDIRSVSIGIGATATFLGLYLGFVFLISGAAILALKALSDCLDSRGRYHMLRQLGADEKAISESLFKQQGLLFLFPLLLALIHSVFGIRFMKNILNQIGIRHTAGSMILTAGILIAIYFGYFLITFFSSRRIIRGQ